MTIRIMDSDKSNDEENGLKNRLTRRQKASYSGEVWRGLHLKRYD